MVPLFYLHKNDQQDNHVNIISGIIIPWLLYGIDKNFSLVVSFNHVSFVFIAPNDIICFPRF